jgi:hypothetical protein
VGGRTNMGLMIGAVEVHTIPACREENVRSNTTLALCLGKFLRINLIVLAGRTGVAAEVGSGVAAVAVLALKGSVDFAFCWVADEHAEAL